MAANQILSLPAAATGLAPAATVTAWVFGAYVQASASLSTDIAVIGVTFGITTPLAVDTTTQYILEISTGAAASEVTKIQIPFSYRMDTAVGYYMPTMLKSFLPEPHIIASGSRVAVRVAHSLAEVITYAGVKILYREVAAAAGGVLYTQLERGIRGMTRGMYTGGYR